MILQIAIVAWRYFSVCTETITTAQGVEYTNLTVRPVGRS